MEAVHVIDATAKGATPSARLDSGSGWHGVWLESKGEAAMVVYGKAGGTSAYQAPAKRALHVVVDGPADQAGMATVTAVAKDGGCALTLAPGGAMAARPAVFRVDADCAVTADPVLTGGPMLGTTAASTPLAPPTAAVAAADKPDSGPSTPSSARPPHAGCCGSATAAAPTSSAPALFLLAFIGLRRRYASRAERPPSA
jgi:hypothetical protein